MCGSNCEGLSGRMEAVPGIGILQCSQQERGVSTQNLWMTVFEELSHL